MKTNVLKLSLLVLLTAGTISCGNKTVEPAEAIENAAEASDLAEVYQVDPQNSTIRWEGSKPLVNTTHFGTIGLASGEVLVADGRIEAGSFLIDMNQITVEDLEGEYKEMLEAHLKGTAEGKENDFFNVPEYPTASFELTAIEDNLIKVNLTLKEITKAVEFPAKITVDEEELSLETESFAIDRTEWGINFGSKSFFPNLGDKFVADDMILTVSLKATRS